MFAIMYLAFFISLGAAVHCICVNEWSEAATLIGLSVLLRLSYKDFDNTK